MDTDYIKLLQEIDSLTTTEKKRHEILLSVCILLKNKVFHYDWVGFYLFDAQESMLILGPYSGKPTEHTRIPLGKGVCGQVAQNKTLKVVQDVSLEGNYISCSLNVQSEIVVPILKEDLFVAEIDIDSHSTAPFTIEDEKFLTSICQKLALLF